MHTVVADLQRLDAGAFALAGFQVQQKLVGVLRQRAQLVELGIVAAGQHATVAQHHRRVFHHRLAQQGVCVGMLADVIAQLGKQCIGQGLQLLLQRGQTGQRVAQQGQIARACAAECHAREHALDIADTR